MSLALAIMHVDQVQAKRLPTPVISTAAGFKFAFDAVKQGVMQGSADSMSTDPSRAANGSLAQSASEIRMPDCEDARERLPIGQFAALAAALRPSPDSLDMPRMPEPKDKPPIVKKDVSTLRSADGRALRNKEMGEAKQSFPAKKLEGSLIADATTVAVPVLTDPQLAIGLDQAWATELPVDQETDESTTLVDAGSPKISTQTSGERPSPTAQPCSQSALQTAIKVEELGPAPGSSSFSNRKEAMPLTQNFRPAAQARESALATELVVDSTETPTQPMGHFSGGPFKPFSGLNVDLPVQHKEIPRINEAPLTPERVSSSETRTVAGDADRTAPDRPAASLMDANAATSPSETRLVGVVSSSRPAKLRGTPSPASTTVMSPEVKGVWTAESQNAPPHTTFTGPESRVTVGRSDISSNGAPLLQRIENLHTPPSQGSSVHELEVSLQSGDVGHVQIRTALEDNHLIARVAVDSHELRNAIGDELSNLHTALAALDVKLQDVSITSTDKGAGSATQHFGGENQHHGQDSRADARRNEFHPIAVHAAEEDSSERDLNIMA